MNIFIGLLMAAIASIIDWQKDKSSLKAAWDKNFLKYIAVAAGAYFASYFPKYLVGVGAACLVYVGWTLIVATITGLFKKKS